MSPLKDKEKRKEYNKQYREKNREKILEYNRNWRKNNREKYNLYNRNYWKKNKHKYKNNRKIVREEKRQLCLIHYGGSPPKCSCCDETIYEFLTIDHIHNNGKEHRKKIGGAGINLYRWLIKNNFPDGFQVLCYNCNWGKFKRGECPHKNKGTNKYE